MQRLVDSFDTPAYAVLAHPDCPIVDWNQPAERVFRRLASEAIGRPAYEILHPRIHPLAGRRRIERLHRRDRWEGRTTLYDREQQPLTFDGTCWATTDANGRKIYVTILRFIPQIAGFLAQNPLQAKKSLPRQSGGLVQMSNAMTATNPVAPLIAANIRRVRREQKISQAELAILLGRHRQHVTMWEAGKSSPTSSNLQMIADVLGVPVDELLKPLRPD